MCVSLQGHQGAMNARVRKNCVPNRLQARPWPPGAAGRHPSVCVQVVRGSACT